MVDMQEIFFLLYALLSKLILQLYLLLAVNSESVKIVQLHLFYYPGRKLQLMTQMRYCFRFDFI